MALAFTGASIGVPMRERWSMLASQPAVRENVISAAVYALMLGALVAVLLAQVWLGAVLSPIFFGLLLWIFRTMD
jgi:fatty acid desaturase